MPASVSVSGKSSTSNYMNINNAIMKIKDILLMAAVATAALTGCGIVMYLDSENWLKGSVEYENDEFQHLGSVATNKGYSDWATTAIPADVKTMWYRFSRREDDYCIECSQDGVNFSQMRICHMYAAADEISFGIYACSPEESSFTALFSDMKITECAWKAHDGQQPDM